MTVSFLDVGQGDAIFIDTPNGNQILIDGGSGKSVLRELSKTMPFYDRSIDVVLVTHPDSDHAGGVPDVLSRYDVDLFVESGVEGETSLYHEVNSKIENLKIKKLEARKGMVIDLGRDVQLEILFPDRDPSGMETNAASIVARLVYGESEFLFTGDSPTSIENYLINLEGLDSDVLKLGHHGSKTSSDPDFISAVSPEYAIISVGKENRYGHPHEEVLETLQKSGIKILRTDEQGRIVFKTKGENFLLE